MIVIGLLIIAAAAFAASFVMFRMSWVIPTKDEKCPYGRKCLLKNEIFLKSAAFFITCIGIGVLGAVLVVIGADI